MKLRERTSPPSRRRKPRAEPTAAPHVRSVRGPRCGGYLPCAAASGAAPLSRSARTGRAVQRGGYRAPGLLRSAPRRRDPARRPWLRHTSQSCRTGGSGRTGRKRFRKSRSLAAQFRGVNSNTRHSSISPSRSSLWASASIPGASASAFSPPRPALGICSRTAKSKRSSAFESAKRGARRSAASVAA